MAWFYVKSGGTATGDAGRHASQQAGSFATLGAANYYGSITDAIAATTPPVAGEFILVSDAHALSTGTSITYTGTATAPGFNIVCVDDSNLDAYRTTEGTRGEEALTGTSADITFNHRFSAWGMSFVTVDNILVSSGSSNTADVNLYDCKITVPGSSDLWEFGQDGGRMGLYDCEIALNNSASLLRVRNNAVFYMQGGSVTTTDTSLASLFNGGGSSGGATATLKGVDLTDVTGVLVKAMGGAILDDNYLIEFFNCKLDAGVTVADEVQLSQGQRIILKGCSSSSSTAEYQYHVVTYGGEVEDDSTIRRAEDDAFEDSGTTISYKITSNTQATITSPLTFDYPVRQWAALSAGASDTLRFYVVSTAALTDEDILVTVQYPDGTNKQVQNIAGSAPSASWTTVINPINGAAALTTDSGSDWRDGAGALAGYNEYFIDVATSGDVGADCVPEVIISVTKPSTTIHISSQYELN